MEERDLLASLIDSLSNLNADSEDGILNAIAVEYNLRLESLELPTLDYSTQYPISVSYDEDNDKIVVTDTKPGDVILVIEDASNELDTGDLICKTTILHYVENHYEDELVEYFG